MQFDVRTAQEYARQGRIEAWVDAYLLAGEWANPALAGGLKLQQRWWRGPLELPLALLERSLGVEESMEFPVPPEHWEARTAAIAHSITAGGCTPLDLPPLIAEYRRGCLSVRDGNHRHGAYARLGWTGAWALIWYNSREDYLAHRLT